MAADRSKEKHLRRVAWLMQLVHRLGWVSGREDFLLEDAAETWTELTRVGVNLRIQKLKLAGLLTSETKNVNGLNSARALYSLTEDGLRAAQKGIEQSHNPYTYKEVSEAKARSMARRAQETTRQRNLRQRLASWLTVLPDSEFSARDALACWADDEIRHWDDEEAIVDARNRVARLRRRGLICSVVKVPRQKTRTVRYRITENGRAEVERLRKEAQDALEWQDNGR